MQALSEELVRNVYVRKVDVEQNKIPQQPILVDFIEAMKFNESLVNINLTGNVGYTENVKSKVALCLLKNMDILKAQQVPIRISWIDFKQIKVLDEQLDEFVKDFIFAEEESFLSRDGNKET